MAVAPVDAKSIMSHCFHVEHLQSRFEHRKRAGRGRLRVIGFRRLRTMSARARRAWAFIAQIAERVFAPVAVFPIDLDAFRFGNGDVFGIGAGGCDHCVRSTSRTPETRRMALTTRSNCFLSRISTVMSTTAPSPVRSKSPRASRLRILHCSLTSRDVS